MWGYGSDSFEAPGSVARKALDEPSIRTEFDIPDQRKAQFNSRVRGYFGNHRLVHLRGKLVTKTLESNLFSLSKIWPWVRIGYQPNHYGELCVAHAGSEPPISRR